MAATFLQYFFNCTSQCHRILDIITVNKYGKTLFFFNIPTISNQPKRKSVYSWFLWSRSSSCCTVKMIGGPSQNLKVKCISFKVSASCPSQSCTQMRLDINTVELYSHKAWTDVTRTAWIDNNCTFLGKLIGMAPNFLFYCYWLRTSLTGNLDY